MNLHYLDKFDGKLTHEDQRSFNCKGLKFGKNQSFKTKIEQINPEKHMYYNQRINEFGWSASSFFDKLDEKDAKLENNSFYKGDFNILKGRLT